MILFRSKTKLQLTVLVHFNHSNFFFDQVLLDVVQHLKDSLKNEFS